MKRVACTVAAFLVVGAAGCSTTSGPDVEPSDTVDPVVWISYPPSNAVIGDEVTIVAEATDSRALSHVEFLVDGETASADSTSPYEFTWDASDELTASIHILSAVAWDLAGNRAESYELPVHCRWRRLIQDGNDTWPGDIDFVHVRSTPTVLEFRVSINGSWDDPHDPEHGIDIGILLDVDQDQSTGLNEDTPGWYAPNDIGADFGASAGLEGDFLWAWSAADTLWEVCGQYVYVSMPEPGSQFEVGIYREDIGSPSVVDVVAVGLVGGYFDWAPDTGHATYYVDGLYIGPETSACVATSPFCRKGDGVSGGIWMRSSGCSK